MTIKKAIEHFEWKFKNHWKPTKSDIDAFNEIVEFTENKLNEQYNNNQLFAKLYITFYGELLRYYKASVFDDIPQKALHKILDTPVEHLIEKFVDKANDNEIFLKMKMAGIDTNTHPALKTPEQKEKESELFNINMLDKEMTVEEATDNLKALINMALTKYK